MTRPAEQIIQTEPALWRGLTRPELDAAYNNMAAVPDSAQRLADWTARSALFRSSRPELLDQRYGPRERQRIDLFRSGRTGAPLLVFVHGGYWQRNAKETFACLAGGPLANGFDVALPGYTLAPDASLTEIVGEIAEALRWLRREGPRFGVGQGQLVVSGWSAGGHLAALAMSLPEVDAGLAISGIFELEPCRLNYLNDKLHLSVEEVDALSPIRRLPGSAKPFLVAYGTCELPELQRQSHDFVAAGRAMDLPFRALPQHGRNHFSILEELERLDGQLTAALPDLVR